MASTSSTRSPDNQSFLGVWQPNQRPPPTQYVARKAQPIKRVDSEPLWRKDIQYDFLYYIFTDKTRAFIDYQAPDRPVVNFCDLYVNALYNSPKCSKVLKDKMVETPAFAIEFAKISLLTNVGRINTTMAFFPEMKTALRSYHPVPSLQKTDGNLQDAPRIKNCLKAALLPFEAKGTPPSTPTAILEKANSGQVPTTSIVNLIFVLATYSTLLGPLHFEQPLDFMDLFLPHPLSSGSRAKAFLWLVFHYYQGPQAPNPFADEYTQKNPGKMPKLQRLTEEEMKTENVDLGEEVEWAKRKSAQRSVILRDLIETEELEKKAKGKPTPLPNGPKVEYARPRSHRSPPPQPPRDDSRLRESHRYYSSVDEHLRGTSSTHGGGHSAPTHSNHHQPYPPRGDSRPGPVRRGRRSQLVKEVGLDNRYKASPHDQSIGGVSLVNHAFRRAMTTDPLAESDDDLDPAEDAESRAINHIDRSRRLYVISRLRGKSVTPEPETLQQPSRQSVNQYHRPNLSHPAANHRLPPMNPGPHSPAPMPQRRIPAYDNPPHQTVITLDSPRNYSNGHHNRNNHSRSHSNSRRSPPPTHVPIPPTAGRLQQVLSWK